MAQATERQIHDIIMATLGEVNEDRDEPFDLGPGPDLILYGTGGVFDSMGLVNFLTTVEEKLEDDLGAMVSLTSEKAVSRKVSPFASVRALTGFILEEIAGDDAAEDAQDAAPLRAAAS
ncbi:hypothetical protein GCM10011505_08540 [Tistrella bauzanensis]|uniref:Carrier domain-containing protein n=1 Tax=Tistrella bauzanensis TaxID=657419 RepID=A0ABQ1I998_9PROT|nr:hypothetical protein [Tistrella bauzanensis]GGB29499.1 hypothetical protein GCM10011505_08540 [Tistrella bauzanensis]